MDLVHHGIKGQRWGVRRFQNADGSLTPAGKKRLEKAEKKDIAWATKNYDKISSKAQKKVSKELRQYSKELLKDPSSVTVKGKISASTMNAYNQKMAKLMNTAIKDVRAPSGKVIKFIAKRGEIGVHMAVADYGYDIDQLKNGVWASGRIAYKKKSVDMA